MNVCARAGVGVRGKFPAISTHCTGRRAGIGGGGAAPEMGMVLAHLWGWEPLVMVLSQEVRLGEGARGAAAPWVPGGGGGMAGGRSVPGSAGTQVSAAGGTPHPASGVASRWGPRRTVPCAAGELGRSGAPKRGVLLEQAGGRRPRRAPAPRAPSLVLQRENKPVVTWEKLPQPPTVLFSANEKVERRQIKELGSALFKQFRFLSKFPN